MKRIFVMVGLSVACLVTGTMIRIKQSEMQKELAAEVFRFHVLANSDSDEDQELKMKVKEEVLSYMKQELPNAENVEMTRRWAIEHLMDIEAVAGSVIEQEGYTYPVKAEVKVCHFPDKSYGDVTFPAGEYEALRIEIGEANGQNWWCVLFPNLCFIDSIHAVVPKSGKEKLKNVLEDDTYEMVTTRSRFKIGWFFF